LRVPLIPGVNDTTEHLNGIAALGRDMPNILGIQIMPYHAMGKGKLTKLGQAPSMEETKAATDEDKNRWVRAIKAAGYEKVSVSG
jgi:pyruvate formate lyase activating enzyme